MRNRNRATPASSGILMTGNAISRSTTRMIKSLHHPGWPLIDVTGNAGGGRWIVGVIASTPGHPGMLMAIHTISSSGNRMIIHLSSTGSAIAHRSTWTIPKMAFHASPCKRLRMSKTSTTPTGSDIGEVALLTVRKIWDLMIHSLNHSQRHHSLMATGATGRNRLVTESRSRNQIDPCTSGLMTKYAIIPTSVRNCGPLGIQTRSWPF